MNNVYYLNGTDVIVIGAIIFANTLTFASIKLNLHSMTFAFIY